MTEKVHREADLTVQHVYRLTNAGSCEGRDKKEQKRRDEREKEMRYRASVAESTSAVRMREVRSQSAELLSAGISRRYITRLYH